MLTELQQNMFKATLRASIQSMQDRRKVQDDRYDQILRKISSSTLKKPMTVVEQKIACESRAFAEAYGNAEYVLQDLLNEFRKLEMKDGV